MKNRQEGQEVEHAMKKACLGTRQRIQRRIQRVTRIIKRTRRQISRNRTKKITN